MGVPTGRDVTNIPRLKIKERLQLENAPLGPIPFMFTIPVEDLGAGQTIAGRIVSAIPSYHAFKVTAVKVITTGITIGVDAANTITVNLKQGADTIAERVYNNVTPFPPANTPGSLTITEANSYVGPGVNVTMNVICGATANPPVFSLQVEGALIKLG